MSQVISLSKKKSERIELVLESWKLLFNKILDEVKQDPEGIKFAILYSRSSDNVDYIFNGTCTNDELISLLERSKFSIILGEHDNNLDLE